jgi:hypothetical protein
MISALLAFGKLEKRQLQDMRRSGAVEGDAGGASVEDQSHKMANTVDRSKQLRKTYDPTTPPASAGSIKRAIGAKKLREAE